MVVHESSWAETDCAQIVVLSDVLLCMEPSPATRLQHCIALRYTAGAEAALTDERALPMTNSPPELPRQRVDWGRPDQVREHALAP